MKSIAAFILSQSILIPFLIGLVRFKTIKAGYLPFFWDVCLGCLAELVSYILIRQHYGNAIPTNLFVLAEWLLLTYQFKRWGFAKKQPGIFYWLVAIPVLIWITENLIFKKIGEFSPYFRVLYSFLIVLLSISEINYLITHENKRLFRHSRFILCAGFLLFFIYQIVYEWAYQLSLIEPTYFTRAVSSLFGSINVLANIIFGIAFLMIPVHRTFQIEEMS